MRWVAYVGGGVRLRQILSGGVAWWGRFGAFESIISRVNSCCNDIASDRLSMS
jgi:hypothetical protein